MEYRVTPSIPLADPARIGQALLDADPAAVFDFDPGPHASSADACGVPALRVATSLDAEALRTLLHTLECEVSPKQVKLLPSVCCGSCSS